MNIFVYAFLVITAWPVFYPFFRTKIYYEDEQVQGRHIKGGTIIVCNHIALFDYVAFLLATVPQRIRVLAAEVLYQKNIFMILLLKMLGAIRVDRNKKDFTCIDKAVEALNKNQRIFIHPEGRLHRQDEDTKVMLPFKNGFIYMAIQSGSPIVPVYCNGETFTKKRARFIIGKPIDIKVLMDEKLSLKENVDKINRYFVDKLYQLGKQLEEQSK